MMDNEKRMQIAQNRIKRLQEELANTEFLGDDEGYESAERKLEKSYREASRGKK